MIDSDCMAMVWCGSSMMHRNMGVGTCITQVNVSTLDMVFVIISTGTSIMMHGSVMNWCMVNCSGKMANYVMTYGSVVAMNGMNSDDGSARSRTMVAVRSSVMRHNSDAVTFVKQVTEERTEKLT